MFEEREQYLQAGLCVTDDEMNVTQGEGSRTAPLEIMLCYVDGREVVYVVVDEREYKFETSPHIGARVRFEYRFGNPDLFLVTFGYDTKSIDYDYVLYEVGKNEPLMIGKSRIRPSIDDLF